MMGRKTARNMYSRNTNKTGIQCVCRFYSQGGIRRLHSIGILRYPTFVKINSNLKIAITCRLTYVVVSTTTVQNSPFVQRPAYFPRPLTPSPHTPMYISISCDSVWRYAAERHIDICTDSDALFIYNFRTQDKHNFVAWILIIFSLIFNVMTSLVV